MSTLSGASDKKFFNGLPLFGVCISSIRVPTTTPTLAKENQISPPPPIRSTGPVRTSPKLMCMLSTEQCQRAHTKYPVAFFFLIWTTWARLIDALVGLGSAGCLFFLNPTKLVRRFLFCSPALSRLQDGLQFFPDINKSFVGSLPRNPTTGWEAEWRIMFFLSCGDCWLTNQVGKE